MAWLVYAVPLALFWGLWGLVHLLGWHPVLDYLAFGAAFAATVVAALVAALDAAMWRGR